MNFKAKFATRPAIWTGQFLAEKRDLSESPCPKTLIRLTGLKLFQPRMSQRVTLDEAMAGEKITARVPCRIGVAPRVASDDLWACASDRTLDGARG
jgi:hypothetical protein